MVHFQAGAERGVGRGFGGMQACSASETTGAWEQRAPAEIEIWGIEIGAGRSSRFRHCGQSGRGHDSVFRQSIYYLVTYGRRAARVTRFVWEGPAVDGGLDASNAVSTCGKVPHRQR